MKSKQTCNLQDADKTQDTSVDKDSFEITTISFGYKSGPAPVANMLFDVRFLDNPYWVDELRPLTGQDKSVQDFVLKQPAAKTFLICLLNMITEILPQLTKSKTFTIAFGCTGGQHRSPCVAEHVGKMLQKSFAEYTVRVYHRELGAQSYILKSSKS